MPIDYRPLASDTLDDAAVKRFLARYLAAWNSHDVETIIPLVTDDVLWQDPTIPGGEARGHAAVRAWLTPFWRTFPDMVFEFLDGKDQDAPGSTYRSGTGLVAAPWRCTATLHSHGRPTRRRIDLVGVDLYTFRGDRLSQIRTVVDTMSAAHQLGVIPRPGSLGEKAMLSVARAAAFVTSRVAAFRH
jgi:steroid delta-isomerase-like uncharacterized protein